MPLTDRWGQGVQYPSLDDRPNARTLGEKIVEGVVPKTVMTFDSASQRGATVTKPTEGMVSWLRDVNRLELFDGSGWVTVAAGTSRWTDISLASGWTTSESHPNNNYEGKSQYRVVNLFGEPTIMFRGGIYRGSYPATVPDRFQITNNPLPAEARPTSGIRTVLVACSDQNSDRVTLKMDLNSNGTLVLFGFSGARKPPWVSLNGVFCTLR